MEQKDDGGHQTDAACGAQTQPGQAGLCECVTPPLPPPPPQAALATDTQVNKTHLKQTVVLIVCLFFTLVFTLYTSWMSLG